MVEKLSNLVELKIECGRKYMDYLEHRRRIFMLENDVKIGDLFKMDENQFFLLTSVTFEGSHVKILGTSTMTNYEISTYELTKAIKQR